MNKSVYLGISISKISKIVMYEFWYNHTKKMELHYMDTDSFIVYIKTEDIYLDTSKLD